MDRSSKEKINKETQVLNDTLGEMNLIDIFRIFHPNAEEYIFFSHAHGTFSRMTTSWVTNQTSVNLRKLKLYQASSLTTCYETRYRLQEKYCKKHKHWRLNNMFLNNQRVTEIKSEIKNF